MTQDEANELIVRIEHMLEELGYNRALLIRARTAAAEAWRTPDLDRRRELLERAHKLLDEAVGPTDKD